jgi:hypothetical protein
MILNQSFQVSCLAGREREKSGQTGSCLISSGFIRHMSAAIGLYGRPCPGEARIMEPFHSVETAPDIVQPGCVKEITV